MGSFDDPEIAEIVNMEQQISGSRNCRNGAISGSRNRRNTAVSGWTKKFLDPETLEMVRFLDPEIVEKVDKSFMLSYLGSCPTWVVVTRAVVCLGSCHQGPYHQRPK